MADTRTNQEWQETIDKTLQSLEGKEAKDFQSYPEPADADALASYIDHTLLKLDATGNQIDQLCSEAIKFKFKITNLQAARTQSVCVRPEWVERCAREIAAGGVAVACVVGFHEGTQPTARKAAEAAEAVAGGARELDMVINQEYVRGGDYRAAFFDVEAVRRAAPKEPKGTLLKVIVETAQLSRAQIVAACLVAVEAGADFVKTSTGFNGGGATVEDVRLMKAVVDGRAKVKASGGVRSREDALAMIAAGADRIGASSGVAIVQGMTSTASY